MTQPFNQLFFPDGQGPTRAPASGYLRAGAHPSLLISYRYRYQEGRCGRH